MTLDLLLSFVFYNKSHLRCCVITVVIIIVVVIIIMVMIIGQLSGIE